MKFVHRILSGSPDTSKELIAAGLFVAVWFLMDIVQFADWAVQKLKPDTSLHLTAPKCEPLAGNPAVCIDRSPAITRCGPENCWLPLMQNNSAR